MSPLHLRTRSDTTPEAFEVMTPAGVTVGAMIVAAGESRRMRGIDKIFTPLIGRPLVAHTIAAFNDSPRIGKIVLVLSRGILDRGRRLVEEGGWDKITDVCAGGARRQDSVRAGLDRLSDVDWVVVHDGARPLVDADIIGRGLDAAVETGAAVAAVPVTDTIKRAGPACMVVDTPPREELWAAQTPQVFRRSVLADAHQRVTEDVTDDAAMVERTGGAVKLFMGSYENIKVSTPEDLAAAQVLLESRAREVRK